MLAAGMLALLGPYQLPVLAMPFILATQLMLFVVMIRTGKGALELVNGEWETPESNLNRARYRHERYPDPAVPVVFVAADPPEAHGAVERMWTALAMGETPGWAFAHDYLERLRWHIDPDWYGELPRTYFHDARHEARAHSGVIDHQSTARWMSAVSPAP